MHYLFNYCNLGQIKSEVYHNYHPEDFEDIMPGEIMERAKKVALKIETGMVSINNASYLQPCSPFGGCKKSGIGREHGKFGFNDLTQIKVIAEEK